jgi:hypothetical protein
LEPLSFFGVTQKTIAKLAHRCGNGGHKNREDVMKLEVGCYCGKARYVAEGER